LKEEYFYDTIWTGNRKKQVWLPSPFYKGRRWCGMSTYEAISLMIAFSIFTISLISLAIRVKK